MAWLKRYCWQKMDKEEIEEKYPEFKLRPVEKDRAQCYILTNSKKKNEIAKIIKRQYSKKEEVKW